VSLDAPRNRSPADQGGALAWPPTPTSTRPSTSTLDARRSTSTNLDARRSTLDLDLDDPRPSTSNLAHAHP